MRAAMALAVSALVGWSTAAVGQEEPAKAVDNERAGKLVLIPAGEFLMGSTDAAAWTATARVLLNLDEFITREV